MNRGPDAETEGLNKSLSQHSQPVDGDDAKADNTESDTSTLDGDGEDVFSGVSPEEIEELRNKLNEGCFENYFSWLFWNTLHNSHGSTLGYFSGFLLIIVLNYEWMLREFVDSNEGHSVAKTFVILFVIYSYSFISMGFELAQLAIVLLEKYVPNYCRKVQKSFKEVISMSEKLKKLNQSRYFCTPAAILWCIWTALMGSILWKWFWWNHICKSYHDRTCKKSWLGQLVIKYRDGACYDGTASSMICERFVSYLPIMLFSVFFVFIGNVFMPLLNDWIATYYPLSENQKAALAIISRLEKSDAENDKLLDAGTSKPEESHNQFCSEHKTSKGGLCQCQCCLNEKESILPRQSEVKIDLSYVKKIMPAVSGVCLLLFVDWFIVKKFFPN